MPDCSVHRAGDGEWECKMRGPPPRPGLCLSGGRTRPLRGLRPWGRVWSTDGEVSILIAEITPLSPSKYNGTIYAKKSLPSESFRNLS